MTPRFLTFSFTFITFILEVSGFSVTPWAKLFNKDMVEPTLSNLLSAEAVNNTMTQSWPRSATFPSIGF